jgi:hypothetical protein
MAWVWEHPSEDSLWGANIDYAASAPAKGVEYLSEKPVDGILLPVFRSQTGLNEFRKLHCPPFSQYPVIDHVWRDIILSYVPTDRVQFLPVRLIAHGEICDDFMFVIPFDRVLCIDVVKSEVTHKIEKPEITLIFAIKKFVHLPNCLGQLHLARDPQLEAHMVLSDKLRDALAATGESSMFRRPKDAESFGT